MAKTTNVKIDGNVLQAEIFRKGLTLAEASKLTGHARNYISQVVRAGKMPEARVPAISAILGIRPERFVVVDVPEPIDEKQLEIETENIDGNMIRNIDVDFVKLRARELGLPLKSFCDVMGKKDNYLYNLRTNGATKSDFDLMLTILRLDKNDERIFRKPQPVEEAPASTVQEIQNMLHKHAAKIAALSTEIKKLKETNGEVLEQNALLIKKLRGEQAND